MLDSEGEEEENAQAICRKCKRNQKDMSGMLSAEICQKAPSTPGCWMKLIALEKVTNRFSTYKIL